MTWENIAADKKDSISATIPHEWRIKPLPTEDSVMNLPKISGIMSPDEIAISESSATELVPQMAAGKLASVAVTTAFCKRTALAHQLVRFTALHSLPNPLTDNSAQLFPRVFSRLGISKSPAT